MMVNFFFHDRGQQIISKRMFLPWYQLEWVWQLTRYPKRLQKFTAFAQRIMSKVISLFIMLLEKFI